MPEERLQKIMAQAGIGSRRANEELILQGRVTVNGKVAELGSKADPQRDTIVVDGHAIPKAAALTYIALHKPRGVLSDVDPQDPRPTVRDLVPVQGHLFTVGRLDMDSEGLILLTNDGDLANKLTHPRYGHEKEYRVLVATRPDEQQLATWRRGVVLEEGERTAPAIVEVEGTAGKGTWMRVVLREGRKRQIREVGKTIGLPVVRIIRERIGTLLLGSLKVREWRYLTAQEIASLKGSTAREARAARQVFPARRAGVAPANRRSRPAGREKAGRENAGPGDDARDGERRAPARRRDSTTTGRPPYSGRSTSVQRETPPSTRERPSRPEGRPERPSENRPARPSSRPARPSGPSERSSDRPARRPSVKPERPSSDRPERPSNRPARPSDRPARPSGGPKGPDRRRSGPAQPRRAGIPRKTGK